MKFFRPLSFAATAFLAVLSPSAHAAHLSVVGLGNLSNPSVDPSNVTVQGVSATVGTSSKWGFGGGALLGFGLLPRIEFETGGLYITRHYDITLTVLGTTTTDTYTQHAVQIPALLRLHLLRGLSVGAGGYMAIGTQHIDDVKNQDLGLLFSAQLKIPVTLATGFILDGRYAMGLTDVNGNPGQTTPAMTEKYRDVQILAGLQFGM